MKKRVSHKQLVNAFMGMLPPSVVFVPTKKNPHAVQLGKLGGSKKSKSKTLASKENGKKGGRPKTKSVEKPFVQK